MTFTWSTNARAEYGNLSMGNRGRISLIRNPNYFRTKIAVHERGKKNPICRDALNITIT